MPVPPQTVDFRLLVQARLLAAKQGATLSARSLTRQEVAARDRRVLIWAPSLYLAIAIIPVILLANQGGREAERLLPAIIAVVFSGTIALAGFGVYRAARRKDYWDPHITIEPGPVNLIIRAPERALALDYAELDLSFDKLVQWDRSGQHVTFIGIVLQTAIGPIRVEDDWFLAGKAAAAMIVVQCEKAGVLLDSLVQEAERDTGPA